MKRHQWHRVYLCTMCGSALCCRNAVGSRQQGRPLLLVETRFCCLFALPALVGLLVHSLVRSIPF